MTLVEFYDNNSIDNILSSLILRPRRVILLGENFDELKIFRNRIVRIFENKKINIKTECLELDTHNYEQTKKFLFELVEKYGECAFDLTGGSELDHVALGAVEERIPFSMHFVSSKTGKLSVLSDKLGLYKDLREPKLSFEEVASVFGGLVKKRDEICTTRPDNFSENIKELWDICRKNCGEWNKTVQSIANVMKLYAKHRGNNTYAADKNAVLNGYKQCGRKFYLNENVIYKLEEKKFFSFKEEGESYIISFKSKLIKEVMTRQGKLFELFTYMMADTLVMQKKRYFDQVLTSVVIDWKNSTNEKRRDFEAGAPDAFNEVDVIMQKGITPVFVSCKNGSCDSDELYKLAVVAEKFGGREAKKVLLTTYFSPDQSFIQRAEELGIKVVSGVHELSYRKFSDMLMAVSSEK